MKYILEIQDILNNQVSVRTNRLKPLIQKLLDTIQGQRTILKNKELSIMKLNRRIHQLEHKVEKLNKKLEQKEDSLYENI